MELYNRIIGYEDIGRDSNLNITATTLNIPLFLTQSIEDIGIYSDSDNPTFEIVTGFTGVWDTTNTGVNQKTCLVLNNCGVNSFYISQPTIFGASDGYINVNGINNCPSPFTFQWKGPNGYTNTTSLNPSGLKAGNYTLKIVDSNCDISYHSFNVTQPQSLSTSTSATNSQINDINGTCNGSATVTVSGGQQPYSYNWFVDNGVNNTNWVSIGVTTDTATGLCEGSYMVQVMDNSGTILSSVVTITEPDVLSGSVITKIDIDCFGANTGYINVTGLGGIIGSGYTYSLTPGSIVNYNGIFNNLPANTYSVQITDSVGSNYNLTPIILTQPVIVSGVISSVNNVTCYNNTNGSFVVTPNGGSGSYQIRVSRNGNIYNIYNTSTPITVNNLNTANYTVDITDTNGCPSSTLSQTIYQRPKFNLVTPTLSTTNGYNIPCFGGTVTSTFSVSYTSDATTIPGFVVTYPINFYVNNTLVSTSYTTSTNITLSAGTYTIKAEDPSGCSVESEITVTQPPLPLSIVGGIDYIQGLTGCTGCGPIDGCRQAIVNVTGGVAPYSISWRMIIGAGPVFANWGNGITSNLYCASEPSYSSLQVIVTDANGCSVTNSISV